MKEIFNLFNNTFNDNDYVVCATSGGVDSMTLLSLLIEYRNEHNVNIICAHINHNLREESFEEFEFVRKYCRDNKIIFEGIVFEKHKTGNFESESRNKRYAFFDKIVKKYNAKYLLTAHHGDDLIETIIMRLVRGSTLDGYTGFNIISDRDSYKILRPLIYCTKQDISDYADENNIEYREDKTNYDIKYTRNRYRLDILPLLKKENENVHKKFIKFSNTIQEASNFINETVKNVYNNLYINKKIDIELAKQTDPFILKMVISKILQEIYGKDIVHINDSHINSIIGLINSNKPNLSINLPLGICAIKNYNDLEIKKNSEQEKYKIEIGDNDIELPCGVLKKVNSTELTNNFICHLNSSEIKLPLYVRNKEDGDYIDVLGLNGSKKIKDIFINEKVKLEKRNNYPVVVDSNDTVLWLPGLKKSKYDSLKRGNYDIILWYIDKEEENE